MLPKASSWRSVNRPICILALNDCIQYCLNKNFKICIAQIVALMPLVNLVFSLAFFLFSLGYVSSNLFPAIHTIYIHIIFYSACYRIYTSCMCKITTRGTQKNITWRIFQGITAHSKLQAPSQLLVHYIYQTNSGTFNRLQVAWHFSNQLCFFIISLSMNRREWEHQNCISAYCWCVSWQGCCFFTVF